MCCVGPKLQGWKRRGGGGGRGGWHPSSPSIRSGGKSCATEAGGVAGRCSECEGSVSVSCGGGCALPALLFTVYVKMETYVRSRAMCLRKTCGTCVAGQTLGGLGADAGCLWSEESCCRLGVLWVDDAGAGSGCVLTA